MRIKLFIVLFLLANVAFSQSSGVKRVLFLGNSYTYVNDLPGLTKELAASVNDTLEYDSNTPGGYSFQMHTTNAISSMLIQEGNWDYVVLQEQSQIPSFPIAEVDTICFPFATRLDSLINVNNPCGETMFYMTWGRKNGDASNCATWPPVCTYEGMDSLLNLRYRMMADSNHAVLSPVGAVWHYIRHHYPSLELYASDESHPSEAGSYAAACTFYTCIFRKNPLNLAYDFTLSPLDAGVIRYAVQKVVFDSLSNWNIGIYDPHAGFLSVLHPNFLVEFVNTSQNANHFYWDFGDGNVSSAPIVNHQYSSPGDYIVKLIASYCNSFDTVIHTVNVLPVSINETEKQGSNVWIYPNPADNFLYINNIPKSFNYNIIRIIDSKGSIVLEKTSKNESIQLDIIDLAPGTYQVIIINDLNPVINLKFIKE